MMSFRMPTRVEKKAGSFDTTNELGVAKLKATLCASSPQRFPSRGLDKGDLLDA